ncbi:NACHT domain-containing protein [Streptomyces sp. AC558_RSS880]|uniref:NACHT domain-containing protein n=1 Tax=Streptomyces sp. AC558_RSS880 TaxID=2823687 RepID=UPI001C23CA1E|nr:NACHT domain-containing protein [Streptomyces sp. AC558_RSS880]
MAWRSDRPWRRRVHMWLFVVLALVSFGIIVLSLTRGASRGNEVAGILGALLGAAGLAVSVADFLRGEAEPPPGPADLADDLAGILRDQWLTEAASRGLRNPRVLPLEWSATERDVSDRLDALVPSGPPRDGAARSAAGRVPGTRRAGPGPAGAGQPARVVRLRLDGRLDGRFDEAADRLAAGYRRIGSGRLVVLGEPGSGKTVLALMLTLGLLDEGRRESGGPVPVLVPVSSWDPVRWSLNDWLVRRLAEAYYAGRPEIPRTLLRHGLLLPVLDGLDEIPEAARRTAVRALNQALGQERPVVITCRSTEYEDVLRAGSPALHRAPVVEIGPVAAEDAVRYLADVSWPDGTDWEPVYRHLRSSPGSPLAQALATPLMISLARTVYERRGGDPGELADTGRFGSRHAVEDHLTEHFIEAAYAPGPPSTGGPADGEGEAGPDPVKARKWLTFLALYLHRHRERDLSWWLMSGRLHSAWAGPGVGLACGALLWALTAVALPLLGLGSGIDSLTYGALLGSCFAVLAMLIWYGTAGRLPGRLSLSLRGSVPRFSRGFRTGLALTVVPAVPVLGFMALTATQDEADMYDVSYLHDAVVLALALALAIACGLAAHECLDAPPSHAAQADPVGSLRDERRSALVGALATGAIVGACAFPLLVVCQWLLGDILLTWISGWSHEPSPAQLLTARAYREAADFGFRPQAPDSISPTAFAALCFLLPGTVTALLVLLSRAWTRFVLLRLAAGVRGRLPWRLMGFLADAHARGVLRQSGGQYQFRHIRLQETLVSRSPAFTGDSLTAPNPSVRRRRLRRAVAAAGTVAAVLAALLSGRAVAPEDVSTARFHVGHRVDLLQFDGDVLLASGDGRLSRWDTRTYGPDTSRPAPRVRSGDDLAPRFSTPAVRERLRKLGIDDATVVDTRTGEELGYLPLDKDDEWNAMPWLGDAPPPVLVDACESAGVRYLWDVATGRPLALGGDADRKGCESGEYYSLVSPDRGLLATDHTDNESLRPRVALWDPASGEPAGSIAVHRFTDASFEALAFSPSSRRLATAHSDGHIHVWDTGTRAHLYDLTGHDPSQVISRLAFDADDTRLASAGGDGSVRVWKLDNG